MPSSPLASHCFSHPLSLWSSDECRSEKMKFEWWEWWVKNGNPETFYRFWIYGEVWQWYSWVFCSMVVAKRMVLGTLKSEKPKFHLGILEQRRFLVATCSTVRFLFISHDFPIHLPQIRCRSERFTKLCKVLLPGRMWADNQGILPDVWWWSLN